MALCRGVLDASVLYAEPVRSLLLWVAAEGGFAPFWTQRILEETGNNLIEGGVVVPEQWNRLCAAMLRAFPDAMLDQAAVDAIEPFAETAGRLGKRGRRWRASIERPRHEGRGGRARA